MACCNGCGQETYKTMIYFLDNGQKIEQCPSCPKKYQSRPNFDWKGIRVRGQFGEKSIRTAAHNDDIKRRILNPDGSVSSNRERVYFI